MIGMKRLSGIMVACALLMLLAFGAGGIGVQRCACTGKISFVSLTGGRCCKSSACMTVRVAQVSAAEQQPSVEFAGVPVCECPNLLSWQDVCCTAVCPQQPVALPVVDSGPPGGWGRTVVLRV